MKLISIKIQNYKSVKDTGVCYLANDLTILAGKNECGKTAILEALRDFDVSVKAFSDAVVPMDSEDSPYPKVEIEIQLTSSQIEGIANEYGLLPESKLAKAIAGPLNIVKFQPSDSSECFYYCSKILTASKEDLEQENKLVIEKIKTEIKNINTLHPSNNVDAKKIGIGEATEIITQINDVVTKIKQTIKNIKPLNEDGTPNAIYNEISIKLQEIDSYRNEITSDTNYSQALEAIVAKIPKFIYFSSFENKLPYELPLLKAAENPAVDDFCRVAGIDLEKLSSFKDTQRRNSYLKSKSVQLTGDFKEYWKQDKITLVAKIDGKNLTIAIEEAGKVEDFTFEQRSQGFQWFLTFYLRLNAEGKEAKQKVLLIDEPGLYLHAKAQSDVLTVLEKIHEDGTDIIFSTHSPYLLNPERFNRIRLVFKDKKKGSIISNKIHAEADAESLTPIVTAIGLNILSNLSLSKSKNVIVEGITDYYLLNAFAILLEVNTDEFSIIPGASASKISYLASLLIGWGIKFAAVLDTDRPGRNAIKDLKKLDINDSQIIRYSEENDIEVEDLLSTTDFKDRFLKDDVGDAEIEKNSKYLKANKLDKVLIAKTFFENVSSGVLKKGDLEDSSLNAFSKVFEDIKKALK